MLRVYVQLWIIEINNIIRVVKYEYDEYFQLFDYDLVDYHLASHTTYVVYVNSIHEWRDLQLLNRLLTTDFLLNF